MGRPAIPVTVQHDFWAEIRSGILVAEAQKRPRSSWKRFAAERPNELWQSDFTHFNLTDGTDLEVIGRLDDHSRYLLHPSAHRRVTGRTVTDTFTAAAQEHGYPTATLTDNGMVYTTRLARGAKITLRHSGKMLHLGIGRAHNRTEIICLIHNDNTIISTRDTGEILAEFTLDPTRNHQHKNG